MGAEITIPILISLTALVIADSNGAIIGSLSRRSMSTQDKTQVRVRLKQLGLESEEDYQNFRLAQFVLVSVIVALFSLALILELISLLAFTFLSMTAAALVLYLLERNLSKRCRAKMEKIESELPALIEMLTLAAGAGESPISSLKRISTRAHGHLALEIQLVVNGVETGTPFTFALDEMSKRVGSASVRRFVDSLIISLSRGTSLIETLSHNVQESRNRERVRLLNAAGKAEISMMIPVVFLILPVSILFALFPSISALNFYGT